MAQYTTREEFMSAVQGIIGDNNTDEALAFVENMADTYDALDGAEWKRKHDELDKSWREKFKKRFFEAQATDPADEPTPRSEEIKIDDLFTEVKKG